MTTPTTNTKDMGRPGYKVFLDRLASLRYTALYPVCWGEDTAIYSTQLRGTQAQGYTCVLCDRLPGDTKGTGFVPVGYVVDTPGCSTLFQHVHCPGATEPNGGRS